jgi:ectoine hydroxylase-related dioxygenase (phytanoyl-CoA dioxygenase family)
MVDLSLLETQGFLVVPDFLNSKEVAVLKWGHDQLRLENNTDTESKHSYEDFEKMFGVPFAVAALVYPKIKQMSDQITASTDIKLNFVNEQCNGFYADLKFINGNDGNDNTLVWHQDQGAWTLHQQSYNYINFYIMVNKENPNTTNLSVIPQNVLTDRIPAQINKIVRQGAQRFFPKDKETLVKNDNTDEEYTLPFNIEDIAKSPNLLPGDVLLVRGDTIHRSQDNLSPRVAASFRVFQS